MNIIKKILTLILLGYVALALLFLFAGKNKDFGRRFLTVDGNNDNSFGDLYAIAGIDRFKERINSTNNIEYHSLIEAEIILMGDSFFAIGFDSLPVANYLENETGKKIFLNGITLDNTTPLEYFQKNNYAKGKQKLFILETNERVSIFRAMNMKADFVTEEKISRLIAPAVNYWQEKHRLFLFKDDTEYFIKNNFAVKPINIWLKNILFDWFGEIDYRTPVYSTDPDILFYKEEVEFNRDAGKADKIEEMAGIIATEAEILKDRYNLTLVYLIIPNKFTLYSDLIAKEMPYDDYIPRLQEALKRRNVAYIDIYSRYREYQRRHPDELLYYRGDTHFNAKGKQLLTDELLKLIQPESD